MARVFIGLPHNGPVCIETVEAILRFASKEEGWFEVGRCSGSSAASNFNEVWCMALNGRQEKRYTHFAMIHHDVVDVDPWWLDTLIRELEVHDADYCHVPLPIKNDDGLTATGVLDPATKVVRRFTMIELDAMPETFTVGYGKVMMAGTGMFVCRFDRPWVEQVYFENRDRIVKVNGEWRTANWTEDWNLSLMMHRLGLKVVATRKVKCQHRGVWQWPNHGVWGKWKTEQAPIDASWVMDLHKAES